MTSPFSAKLPNVRTSNSDLQFSWREITDPSISALYFRFLGLTQWSPLPEYKSAAILSSDDMPTSSDVTLQLRAENQRGMTSEIRASSVSVDDTPPSLTGKS